MKGCLTCVENVCVDQCYAGFLVVQLRHLCQGTSFGILADTILREAYETIPDGVQSSTHLFSQSQTFLRVSSSLFLYIRPNPTVNSPA